MMDIITEDKKQNIKIIQGLEVYYYTICALIALIGRMHKNTSLKYTASLQVNSSRSSWHV